MMHYTCREVRDLPVGAMQEGTSTADVKAGKSLSSPLSLKRIHTPKSLIQRRLAVER
jgi:hypothetical protein